MFDGLDPLRGVAALGAALAYAGVCVWSYRRLRARRGRPGGQGNIAWHVIYASQTGFAQSLAHKAAALLGQQGAVRCIALNALAGDELSAGGRFLFVLATAGDGEAPDNGAHFASGVMRIRADLAGVDYGVLALGDRSYRHYCAFGHRVAAWLAASGGRRSFEMIEVDRGDPAAIAEWQQHMSRLAGADDSSDWAEPGYAPWRLAARTHVNPGSAGNPVFRLEFVPCTGGLPAWQAGDLARIRLPAYPEQPRDYSITSLPGEGCLRLLIRLHVSPEGRPGLLSGWLTGQMAVGDQVPVLVRAHGPFRQAGNAHRPMILIGNGVGVAGLRAHLKARIDAGQFDNWLVFGERDRHCDNYCGDELAGWRAGGFLQRLDAVFSRDGVGARYVQDIVQAQADVVRTWVERGAAIYVCGNQRGMAEGVDQALRCVIGAAALAQMRGDGRYRRDVF